MRSRLVGVLTLGAVLGGGFAAGGEATGRPVVNAKADGYKGIWFTLGQRSAHGDKYSGGLGTYTAHHVPLAIHAPAVNKTFFVYGGTTAATERRLLIMASEYDHATHTVPKPTIVLDKSAELGEQGKAPHCPLPAARCPLPAARCPLPAARCPLPADQ